MHASQENTCLGCTKSSSGREPHYWTHLLVAFALAMFILIVLQNTAPGMSMLNTTDTMTLGSVLMIGLVAGCSSCMAVTSGLLLGIAGSHQEHRTHHVQALVCFHVGRFVTYTLLGAVIGALGQLIQLGTGTTGLLTIVIALVMIMLALSLLGISPALRLPAFASLPWRHFAPQMKHRPGVFMPLMLGALTFFLPCGFTQSMQLLALASGSAWSGALIMSTFALGTLPFLLGISALSTVMQGDWLLLFRRTAGALVLILSVFTLRAGITLATGKDVMELFRTNHTIGSSATVTDTDEQVIGLHVSAYAYDPPIVSIAAGRTTWIDVEAGQDVSGCTSIITVPAFKLRQQLAPGTRVRLGPIENPQRDFIITCGMGMVSTSVRVASAL